MGNCISCQGQGAPEKHWSTNGGRNAPMTRKAAMERYPIPTRCRVSSSINEPILTCESSSVSGAVNQSDSGDSSNCSSATGLRSKLRLPTAGIHLQRPQSIPLNKVTDSNGNIPRLSNLPRFKGSFDSNIPPKCQLSSSSQLKGNVRTTLPVAVVERVNTDICQLKSTPVATRQEDAGNSQPNTTTGGKQPSAPETASGSRSPTLSSVSSSTVHSNRSNRSTSLEDSGIASAAMSPAISEKKTALSLKFGFHSRKKTPTETKTALDSINVLNHQLSKEQPQQIAAPTPLKILNQNAVKDTNLSGQQQATPKVGYTIKDRINLMRGYNSSSHLLKTPVYSSHTSTNGGNSSVAAASSIPTPGHSSHKSARKLQKGLLQSSKAQPVKLFDSSDGGMNSLALVKNRAALVLKQSTVAQAKPAEPKPKLSIEAIVASLEQEIRQQIGEDETEIPIETIETPKEKIQAEDVTCLIDHYDLRPLEAQVMFVESPVVEFIENITPIDTPSSICTTFNSQRTPDGDDPSREDRSRGDEEDSAATSISDDAMIDDEIADQPGLLMLGQSASVPSSPSRSWRLNLYDCHVPAMSLASCHSLQSEEELDELSDSTRLGLLRRRVASVSGSEIGDGVRDDLELGVKELKVKGNEDDAMRTELYSPWQETIVVDLEEYTAMANELADIKTKLIALQTLLMEIPEAENRCSNVAATPLWDLKRDIVLLREELQEKNLTIRTLKNELRASAGKTHERVNSSSSSPTASRPKKVTCANVATQTDRPRIAAFSNGSSPSNEDVQLVSFRIGQF